MISVQDSPKWEGGENWGFINNEDSLFAGRTRWLTGKFFKTNFLAVKLETLLAENVHLQLVLP
jgi:hypothetical protein